MSSTTLHQFSVCGRKRPTATLADPQIFRMRIFAKNATHAKSRFWYLIHQYHKMKKETGEILACNEITEKSTRYVKNYSVWLRYNSRTGTHNMTKQFRDVSVCGAIQQLYTEMASRHRARQRSVQIMKVREIGSGAITRTSLKQFITPTLKFPQPHRAPRAATKKHKTTFKASRPCTFVQ